MNKAMDPSNDPSAQIDYIELDSIIEKEFNNDKENLIVKNNLNIREDIEHSTKLGLENLKERFKQFTASPVIIEETESQFKVSLPVLTKLHYERFNI